MLRIGYDGDRLANVAFLEPEVEQRAVVLRTTAKAERPQEGIVERPHASDVGDPEIDMVEDHGRSTAFPHLKERGA